MHIMRYMEGGSGNKHIIQWSGDVDWWVEYVFLKLLVGLSLILGTSDMHHVVDYVDSIYFRI